MVYAFRRGPNGMGQNGSNSGAEGQRFAAVREVRAYWDALRDDQHLPRREQINPCGMAGALHQVFMVERIAPGLARFRLAGMDVNDLMGMEVRGMPLSSLFDPGARARLADLVEKVFTKHSIVKLDLEADRGIGRPSLRARLLLLPLKGAAGETDLILGCLAFDGQIGRAPRRFVIARAIEETLDAPGPCLHPLSERAPNQATKTAFAPRPAPISVAEMAEPAGPKYVAKKQVAERPYLRLVRMED